MTPIPDRIQTSHLAPCIILMTRFSPTSMASSHSDCLSTRTILAPKYLHDHRHKISEFQAYPGDRSRLLSDRRAIRFATQARVSVLDVGYACSLDGEGCGGHGVEREVRVAHQAGPRRVRQAAYGRPLIACTPTATLGRRGTRSTRSNEAA